MKTPHFPIKTLILILIIAGLGVAVGGWVFRYFGWWQTSALRPGEARTVSQTEGSPTRIFNAKDETDQPIDFQLEVVAADLFVPWDVVFTGDVTGSERILITERSGAVREIVNGQLQAEPVMTMSEVTASGESGLMGMVRHPDYAENGWLYLCLSYQEGGETYDRVKRVVDPAVGTADPDSEAIILDQIPAAQFHAGCRLGFGPDNKLFITTGDATEKPLAQNTESLAGKILRVNDDGTIPDDNPIQNSAVYSLGHRNPQGIAWHPITGDLWQTEHGPSVFDGPAGGDEINLIQPGGNYGWPTVSHQENRPGLIAPKMVFTPAEAPGSALIYDGSVFPQFKNNLLFGALRGEGIVHAVLDPETDYRQVTEVEKLPIEVGRIRTVVQGPDGLIYFTTSNRDGRGSTRPEDDKLYRLVPAR